MSDSEAESPTIDAIDVALLRLRYIAAFERYRALAEDLVDHSEGGRAPVAQHIDAEQKALQELAAVRSALLDALAESSPELGSSLLAETRDEMIRRSIAKRSEGVTLTPPVGRPRLSRSRRTA